MLGGWIGVNKIHPLRLTFRVTNIVSFDDGISVTNIVLSTSESWKDKRNANPQWQNEYHRVVFYGRLAEFAGEYLRKDSKVYIEGSIHTRKWQDKTTGQDRYSTEIKASALELIDSRSAGSNQPASGGDYGNNDYSYGGGQQDDYQAAAPRAAANKPANNRPAPVAHNDLDDDLPF